MGTIGDISDVLAKIPLWKRLSAVPKELEDLRARVAAIEERLAGGTGVLCPMCNAAGFARVATKKDPMFGDMGIMVDSFRCQACGHQEDRTRDTMQR